MSFSSGLFLIFMVVFLAAFFATQGRLRSVVLLASSYLFYGFHEPLFVPLIALSTATDFFCAQQIEKSTSHRKAWLRLSLVVNLGLLGWFKYQLFFEQLLFQSGEILDFEGFSVGKFIIPIGISFYTFQTIGYTIDVYRKTVKAEKNVLDFFVFVSFFPQLIAGPIERFNTLMPQLKKIAKVHWRDIPYTTALSLILWGLFRKIVVADRLGMVVDKVFDHPETYSGMLLLGSGFLFMIQIYMDFSGYTMMARGLAKAIGIELSMNWNFPLFQTSTRGFWRHWHLTLTQWFRDYIYFPLGGNRKGRMALLSTVLLIFVVSGLWHGANLTFVIWGTVNGLIVLLEILLLRHLKFPSILGWMGVLLTQSVLFLIFRSASTNRWIDYMTHGMTNPVLDWRHDYAALDLWSISLLVNFLVLIVVFAVEWRLFRKENRNYPEMGWIGLGILLMSTLILGEFGSEPFIYFQF